MTVSKAVLPNADRAQEVVSIPASLRAVEPCAQMIKRAKLHVVKARVEPTPLAWVYANRPARTANLVSPTAKVSAHRRSVKPRRETARVPLPIAGVRGTLMIHSTNADVGRVKQAN